MCCYFISNSNPKLIYSNELWCVNLPRKKFYQFCTVKKIGLNNERPGTCRSNDFLVLSLRMDYKNDTNKAFSMQINICRANVHTYNSHYPDRRMRFSQLRTEIYHSQIYVWVHFGNWDEPQSVNQFTNYVLCSVFVIFFKGKHVVPVYS